LLHWFTSDDSLIFRLSPSLKAAQKELAYFQRYFEFGKLRKNKCFVKSITVILLTTFWETMISLTMGWIRILVNYTADSSHCACPAAASLSSLFIVALTNGGVITGSNCFTF